MQSLVSYRVMDAAVEKLQDCCEDRRYPSPVQLLQYFLECETSRHLDDVCRHYGKAKSNDVLSIRGRLELLEEAGLLLSLRKDEYRIPMDRSFAEGVVSVNSKGDGSVILSSESDRTIPLTKSQVRRVVHGDRVLCLLVFEKKNFLRAHVLGVLNRVLHSIVGEFAIDARGRSVVNPINGRVFSQVVVRYKPRGKVREGDIVKVTLTSPPFAKGGLFGEIIEVMGESIDPMFRTTMILHKYGVPHLWPDDVIDESRIIESGHHPPTPDSSRQDLRGIPFMTIDGSDARDFDDAVYCSEENSGWRLIVAIADVSHYVETGSALDREAYERGTSVYFPDQVIPMLPEVLSNGICSLNPGKDRNSLVCDMRIDRQYHVSGYRFYQAVIKSEARMTYEAVEAFLTGSAGKKRIGDGQRAKSIQSLKSVAAGLESDRMASGSITFELPEARIQLNADGQVGSVGAKKRLLSHKIIEECMLVANRCAAEFIHQKYGNRALYRIHPGPSPEDIVALRQNLQGLGVLLDGGKQPVPMDFQRLLEGVMDSRQLFDAVQILLLQRMGRASYSPELSDHFALGFTQYTHFTSPIRRYGDLVVHRLIKTLIKIPSCSGNSPSLLGLDETSLQCSMTERRADVAVYDAIAWFKALYMVHRIGRHYSGVVTGVREFGLFVRLDEIFVDGLVHISKIGQDYYVYDETRQTLCGDSTGETFRLGARVEVHVLDVDLSESRVSLSIYRDWMADSRLS